MIWKSVISGLILFFCASFIFAIPPIILRNSQTFYEIGDKVSLLEDRSSSLTFSDVISKTAAFKKSTLKIPTWGVTKSAIWVKISVENKSENPNWNLEIGYPTIHELDFYEVNAEGAFVHQEIGSRVYFDSAGVIRSNHIIIPFDIGKGEQRTFYLRAKSRNGLRLPLRIETMQTLYEKNHPKDFINSIYFGLIIALTIYNLFIYLNIRDITYLFYVLYIFFFGLNIAYLQGYGFEFIDNKLYAWNGGVSIVFGTLFSVSFFAVKTLLFFSLLSPMASSGFCYSKFYFISHRELYIWF